MTLSRTLNLLSILVVLTLLTPACVRQSAERPATIGITVNPPAVRRININRASAAELTELPGIGKALAERIVAHRETYGPFRRPEHLMMVRGFGDQRVRALLERITIE